MRLLTVARLVPDKNVGGLIEAFARAGLTPQEAELHIAGSGPLEQELRALAARLDVPVRFAGYTAPEDLPAAYAAADVFVLPSLFEPFGVVVREAVAAGLPVVCSPTVGAAGDIAVEERNALLARHPRGARRRADARSSATASCAPAWPVAAASWTPSTPSAAASTRSSAPSPAPRCSRADRARLTAIRTWA